MTDRDAQTLNPSDGSSPMTTYAGSEIEVAWNPARRRWEAIYPEDEGYDDVPRIPMLWCRSAGRYVTIPTN